MNCIGQEPGDVLQRRITAQGNKSNVPYRVYCLDCKNNNKIFVKRLMQKAFKRIKRNNNINNEGKIQDTNKQITKKQL